jgi:hypothetical protein
MFEPLQNPSLFDIMLMDINSKTLHDEIGKALKIEYLSEAQEEHNGNVIKGITFGPFRRTFVPIVVALKNKKRWVLFLVDTNSPNKCEEVIFDMHCILKVQALTKGFGVEVISSSSIKCLLNGLSTTILPSPSNSHFPDVNVLGTDFLTQWGGKLTVDYLNSEVELQLRPNAT